MTERILLAGKVAVVTGAGRGLGRAYVELLAERGARVVVNDLGTNVSGFGKDAAIAAEVADLIRSRGGEAIANDSDVSTPQGGRDLIAMTIEHFGRIDLLVNTISPVGYTRMHPAAGSRVSEAEGKATTPVEAVAPAIVWLASDGCSETNRIYNVTRRHAGIVSGCACWTTPMPCVIGSKCATSRSLTSSTCSMSSTCSPSTARAR